MEYAIIVHKSKYGYDIHVPSLPGCHSQGSTERKATENIKDAIRVYIAMEQSGLKGAKVREVEVPVR